MVDARPAALVQGQSVPWGALRDILNEAAGGLALEEVILERRLRSLLAERKIIITKAQTQAELNRLLDSLDHDPDRAAAQWEKLRVQRGLGTHRLRGLLWRNAALRALVQDRVRITEAKRTHMSDLLYGEKRQARLITTQSLSDMEAILARLDAGESFLDLAVSLSTDASAARGGLLEPISREDDAYPPALRKQLWTLKPDDISPPLLLNDQYGVVKLIRVLPPTTMPEDAEPDALERLVRQREERRLMDQLARRLLEDVKVTIFDSSLQTSWKQRRSPPP